MLCLSTNPLLSGDLAAVTLTVMFMASHSFKNWLLANSLRIQILNMLSSISFGSFDFIILDDDNLVAWLTKGRSMFPL